MPVQLGDLANADLFNSTFLDKTVDDETTGVLCLNAPNSGGKVSNVQLDVNELKSKVLSIVSSVQLIGASGTLSVVDAADMTLKVSGDSMATEASLTPFASNPADGALIRLEGTDNTNTVKFAYNDAPGGLILNGDAVLGKYQVLILRYDAADNRYIEQTRNF